MLLALRSLSLAFRASFDDDEDGCGLDDAADRAGDVLLLALRSLSLAFRASFFVDGCGLDDAPGRAGDVMLLALRSLSLAFSASFFVDDICFLAAGAGDVLFCILAAVIDEPVSSPTGGERCVDDDDDDGDGCGLDDAAGRAGDVLLLALRSLSLAFRASFFVDDICFLVCIENGKQQRRCWLLWTR
jgi:hypothetical protein